MDYQAFNSQHAAFGGAFPALPGTPAHLGQQPTHSPQQPHAHSQYGDPQARFLQSQAQSSPSPFQYQQHFAGNNAQGQPPPPFAAMGSAPGGLMQLQQARGKPAPEDAAAVCLLPERRVCLHV